MAADEDSRSQTFSTKEMLIRVDGKIDAVLARQQNYDVDLALVKARIETFERMARDQRIDDLALREEVRKEINRIDRGQDILGRRQAYQTGAVATIVVVVNVAVPVIMHLVH